MSLDQIVEEIIRDAMARGEFDNLPGRGKPLDLDAYFALPEEQRLAYTLLKNAGYVPEEVDLLRGMKALKDQLAACSNEAERQALTRKIDRQMLKLNLLQEQKQHACRKARKTG